MAKRSHACLLLTLNVYAFCLRRGPHHPHGQMPVEPDHHHYVVKRTFVSITGDYELLHDTKHLEEDHVELTAEELSKMTPEELEFHYFSAHDFDKNSMLDGLELLKAVFHTVDHNAPHPEGEDYEETETENLESYVGLVDRTLESDDTDGDGYVSYAEYRAARARQPQHRTHRVLADDTQP